MPTVLRAVSLDLDNTLWDTPPILARAEASLRAWLVAEAPRLAASFDDAALARLRQAVVADRPALAHDMTFVRTESLRRAALAVGESQSLAEAAFEIFIAERNRVRLYPEVEAALDALAARVPLYAVTNGNACVQRAGLGRYFKGSIDAATVGAPKPDPRIYAQLMLAAGVSVQAVLHVGDDAIADVDGARAFGLRTAWMNRVDAVWPQTLPPADHEVPDLTAVVAIVEESHRH